ncbi:MAG: hypothetical protein JO247_03710 [Chloroflexi bacterium]|nr:hypothetical protein [Chloroflexota bacterium]
MPIDAVASTPILNGATAASPVRTLHYMPLLPMLPVDNVQIEPGRTTAGTDNPWQLDLHTGKIELSALFTHKSGEISKCDKDGFIMTVEDQGIKILADPAAGAGHVQATVNGKTTPGTISHSGNRSTLHTDDGGTITVTAKSGGHFSVSGIAPVTVDVRYVDGIQPGATPPTRPNDPRPWYMGKDPATMTFAEKVKTIFKSLFTVSGQ